jgi:DNA replication and repair protein RecF
LRSARTSASPLLLDTYDEQLARLGARIVVRRRVYVRALNPLVSALFRSLHADLAVELAYLSSDPVAAAKSELEVAAALIAGLRERRGLDGRRGHTTFGPQTDDLEIKLADRPARAHASQGQLRSIVLALKLAELANLESARGEAPILLLDDVPSELDATRRRYLFDALATLKCQALITVADRSVVPPGLGRRDFRVDGGEVEACAPAP